MCRATQPTDKAEQYGLLLAPLAGAQPTRYGQWLLLKHLKDYSFWMGEGAWREFNRRFPRELVSLGSHEPFAHLLAIMIVGRGRAPGHFNVVGGSLMQVTPQLIPVHSQYQALVANALVEAERTFLKPLHVDAREADSLPDFLLLDAGERPLPMEIYGFTGNPAHEQRKQEKLAGYRASRQPFWHWDVAATGSRPDAFPRFPSCAGGGMLCADRSTSVDHPGGTAAAHNE